MIIIAAVRIMCFVNLVLEEPIRPNLLNHEHVLYTLFPGATVNGSVENHSACDRGHALLV